MAPSKQPYCGADILVRELKSLGVEVIFAITGAGNLAVIDAIARDGSIDLVYSHHEQAAVMEAQGYSRITNKLGVALVTTGAGTSNAVTGILSAHLDSIPVLLISGNESSFHCINPYDLRAYGVQGFDSCAVLKPVSKMVSRITNVEEISPTLRDSVNAALGGRMGPVHIDFPMDLQRKQVGAEEYLKSELNSSLPMNPSVTNLNELSEAISKAKAPLFYFGNGIRNTATTAEARLLLEKTGIPFILSWSAIDIFPEADGLNVGRVGIYGDRHANILLQKSDLIIAVGTRLAIPQVGYDKSDFGRLASKWIVEIDATECRKFDGLGWNVIQNDALSVLNGLNKTNIQSQDLHDWREECSRIKRIFPRRGQLGPEPQNPTSQIHSGDVIEYLNQTMAPDAFIGTDVGAALLTGHYMYEQSGTRRFFTSQGLGEMGFGLPGTIGAYFADTSRQIVCLNTDGALMFNLQELQVVREHKIPLKLFIFNNFGYSMIKISQDNLFEGRLAGSDTKSGVSFPDFSEIASTFGFKHTLISTKDDLSKMDTPLRSHEAELIEIVMDPEQRYFPRLATNKLDDGTFVSPPLEDMDPKIELSLLENLLGYKAHENSYKARGLT
jgi:acetolactate synthase I/II/III large subunit